MKHLKQFVALALVLAMAVSLSFAGAAKGVTAGAGSSTLQAAKPFTKVVDEDMQGRPQKSSGIKYSADVISRTSKPVPNMPIDKASARSTFAAGLSGTYHIPGAFPSISAAASVLNFLGVSGNVDFVLDSASYTENSAVTFGSFPGAGTFTVTISPAAGQAVTVNFLPNASEGKGFAFNGAKKITVDGLNTGGASLTLKYAGGAFPLSDPFAATIYITGASSDIAVKNTNIEGQVNDPVWANQTEGRAAIFIWAPDADPDGSSNITIDGCTITNATYAIKILTELNGYYTHGLVYKNNHIGGAYGNPVAIGALAQWVEGLVYDNNIVDGVTFLQNYWYNPYTEYDADVSFFGFNNFMFDFGQATGGHWLDCPNGVFSNYIIRNIGTTTVNGDGVLIYGMRTYGLTASITHKNGRIYDVMCDDGASSITGIRGPGTNVYHTTVRLTGAVLHNPVSTCINSSGTFQNDIFSNEITGGTAANTRGVTAGGSIDYCAINSTGRYVSGLTGDVAAVAAGWNTHGVYGSANLSSDLHIAGPSSAENIGNSHILPLLDIDGDSRDTTIAGQRDAGADEIAPSGSPIAVDLFPVSIPNPLPGGVPALLPLAPTVVVKNNSNQAVASVTTRLQITDGYDQQVVTGTGIPAHGEITVTFPNWVPPAGTWSLTATNMTADANASNDALVRGGEVVTAAHPIPTAQTYTWDASDEGWTRRNDFVRDNAFTKLGGPLSGYSMVTEAPGNHAIYSQGVYTGNTAGPTDGYSAQYVGPNVLESPWLDISGMTGDSVYISFSHSIATEPGWDASWVEYTTDGVHWHHLGQINDPNGINWYPTAVYENALSFTGNPLDTATMQLPNYQLYGPGTGNPTLPMAMWTSNGPPGLPSAPPEGDGHPQGPFGYVFAQLHITPATYPDIVHASLIKFRYVAFSDAVNPPNTGALASNTQDPAFAGWAVDNFRIGSTGSSFTGGIVNGHVFNDVNGNGVNDAEPNEVAGLKVYLSYFGVLKDSTLTNGTGDYSFDIGTSNSGLPGTYDVRVVKPGYAFSTPSLAGVGHVDHPSTGGTLSINFGTYQGSISGTKFNDLNDNGAKDLLEPGVGGWTIEVHKDSANGGLISSQVTDGSGNYSMVETPGTYYVKEVAKASARQTMPVSPTYYTVVIGGNSGSPTANITGQDFGNWFYASIRVALTIDINGDGIVGGGDVLPLPSVVGTISVFTVKKDGSTIFVDTLGNGVASITHSGLNAGTYDVIETAFTPGWIRTKGGTFTHAISASGTVDTARYMDFKMLSIIGRAFEDLNGNGVDDGEPGLSGWTVSVTGNALGGTSAVSDSIGNFVIDSVSTGAHTISEAPQVGWSQTLPATNYSFTAVSGNLPNPVATSANFGNFHNISISGTKYRDKNNNGVKDPEDDGLSGWTINLNPGAFTAVTDANGNYTFTGVGGGAKTLTETPQAGWVLSAPVGGQYVVNGTSNVNVTGKDFGNYRATDSTAYRTFTAAQLQGDLQKKPNKKPKAGKPILAGPNTGNLLADILTQGGVIKVGLPGQLNAGGKEKAYIQPAKQGDVWKSLNAKSVFHTGAPRGLDLDVKGKLLLKRYKAIPPTKKNSTIIANLLALQVNLAASSTGKTPVGLGALVYADDGSPLNGMSLDSIADYADGVMTNWEGQPYSVYVMLDSVAAKVNAAFATGFVDDTTATGGWFGAKLQWVAATRVIDVPFLKSSSNPAQSRISTPTAEVIPTEFALAQNYPNPFNPTTTIQFDLAQQSMVTLKIYNLLGQEVATLLNHEEVSAGTEELEFDASSLASGVYLYRIVAESVNDDGAVSQTYTQVKKMVLLK